MTNKELYYKSWAILQKQDIAFFTYPEIVQNLAIVLLNTQLAFKIIDIIKKYKKEEN